MCNIGRELCLTVKAIGAQLIGLSHWGEFASFIQAKSFANIIIFELNIIASLSSEDYLTWQ